MIQFSQRELQKLDQIYQDILNETDVRKQNAIIVGRLRNQCENQRTGLLEYLRFKFQQETEKEIKPPQREKDGKNCLFCQELLKGKQTKFCSDNHKVQFYNLQKNPSTDKFS
jgi:superfamily II DNA helicase RecQ